VFAGDLGVAEDPATGSAALAHGAYLVAVGLLPADGVTGYTVRQGVEMGRPSTLHGEVTAVGGRATCCRVSGGVVPVAAGELREPPR
jgi:trans-2,3-dihydro-3-hydroxyanthranilate isomerase